MACLSPARMRGLVLPCSRCEPCRRRRHGETVSRLLAEGVAHKAICMVTLTYRARDLPEGGELVPADVSSFLRRLRINWERYLARDPRFSDLPEPERKRRSRLRFFVVGEYGGRFGRPHFHLICFGADRASFANGVPFSRLVHEAWSKGSVHVGGGWSFKTAAYVSGYVAKGHNVKGHVALDGRHPEFSRWPNGARGGLGVPGLPVLFPAVQADERCREAALSDALPHRFSFGGAERWLGAFLVDRLRKQAGLLVSEIRELKAKRSWLRSWSSAFDRAGFAMGEAAVEFLSGEGWSRLSPRQPSPFVGMLRAVRGRHAVP